MTPSHLSFAEQALRYFDRPHDAIVRAPLTGPAAWRGEDLARRDEWVVPLDARALTELEDLRTTLRAHGKTVATLTREDVVLPTLRRSIADWRRELLDGRGFLVIRGLPVERWGEEDSALVYWALGLALGHPGAQNPQGDLLGHVHDTGEDAADPFVRRYRTAAHIAYHCDLADAVGLLCLRAARAGGASRLVSSVTVYNELLQRRPDLIERLYEPFCLDRRNEQHDVGPGWVPVIPCRFAGGQAADLLPQRLLPLGHAPRRRAALHGGGAGAARSLRIDRGGAGAPARHAVRPRRHPARVESRDPARAHGVRGRARPDASAPPAAALAFTRRGGRIGECRGRLRSWA
ncbi:MAG: TauD/TfdA family dioxygenase, partial [Candidatus Binatia bacterium]